MTLKVRLGPLGTSDLWGIRKQAAYLAGVEEEVHGL